MAAAEMETKERSDDTISLHWYSESCLACFFLSISLSPRVLHALGDLECR